MKKMFTATMVGVGLLGLVACAPKEEAPEVETPVETEDTQSETTEATAESLAQNIQASMSAYMDGELKVVDGVLEAYGNYDLTKEEAQLLYADTFDFDQVKSGIIIQPMMNIKSDLIVIVEAKDEEAKTSIRASFDKIYEQQDATWSTYLPDQYEKVQNAQLVENGDFLMMVIFDDPQVVIDAFSQTIFGTYVIPEFEPKTDEGVADVVTDEDVENLEDSEVVIEVNGTESLETEVPVVEAE